MMRQSMRLAVMGLAVAGFAGFSGIANAADVYAGGGGLKDEPLAAFSPTWAGLYFGGTVGYGWGKANTEIEGVEEDLSTKPDGLIVGAHLGYNFQRDNIVFGVEAGINGTALGDSIFDGAVANDLNWYGTGVGRLGYSFGNTLLYGFGGVAWGEVQTKFLEVQAEETHVGWTAGFGVERAINDHLSLRLEYSHVDLGSEDVFKAEGCSTCEVDLNFDVVKVGASYKFGSREEALK
jgi:outer membrane immunogenic protein